jgi:hypothetical protein
LQMTSSGFRSNSFAEIRRSAYRQLPAEVKDFNAFFFAGTNLKIRHLILVYPLGDRQRRSLVRQH